LKIGIRTVAEASVVPSEPPPKPDLRIVGGEPPPAILVAEKDRTLLGAGGTPLTPAFTHDPDRPTHSNWSRYCDWRVSKCPRRRIVSYQDAVGEINHATLEFLGELGELACHVGEHGAGVLMYEDLRAEAIDEAGDCFFTGSWALDAWGFNLLRSYAGVNEVGILEVDGLAQEREVYSRCRERLRPDDAPGPDEEPSQEFMEHVKVFEHYSGIAGLTALAHAAQTANALKKIIYQGVGQDPQVQASRIMVALGSVERILAMIGATVEDALKANVAKLDARFPDGWKPGGGIRSAK
jgi:hypothetical protein